MPEAPAPTPVALVLCDSVYRSSNGKQALIGVFNRIIVRETPAAHPSMCVFVSVTSIRPATTCKLDIVNAETDQEVFSMQGPAPDDIGPIAVWDVVFELPPLTFPEAGIYYVRFLGNESILMQRPIEVIRVEADSSSEEEQ